MTEAEYIHATNLGKVTIAKEAVIGIYADDFGPILTHTKQRVLQALYDWETETRAAIKVRTPKETALPL
jgi:hypothetical protein